MKQNAISPAVAAGIVGVVLLVIVGGYYMMLKRSSTIIEDKNTVFQRPGQANPAKAPGATGKPTETGAITGGGGITARPGSNVSPFGAH